MHGMTSQKLNLDNAFCENVECKNKKIFLKLITVSNNFIQNSLYLPHKVKKSFSEYND